MSTNIHFVCIVNYIHRVCKQISPLRCCCCYCINKSLAISRLLCHLNWCVSACYDKTYTINTHKLVNELCIKSRPYLELDYHLQKLCLANGLRSRNPPKRHINTIARPQIHFAYQQVIH